MRPEEALDKLLGAYLRYYNINKETPTVPFAAEAVFQTHDEQYFLFKSAKLTDYDSSEHIFFALEDELTADRLALLDTAAWEEGMKRVHPGPRHRSTDVGLCILANHVSDEARKLIPRLKRSKSYRFGLQGYSLYRLVAYDLSEGVCVRNRLGDTLEKAIVNILF